AARIEGRQDPERPGGLVPSARAFRNRLRFGVRRSRESDRLWREHAGPLRSLRAMRYGFAGGVHRAGLSAGPLSRYTSWQVEQASARSLVASDTFSWIRVLAAARTARPAVRMPPANVWKSACCSGTG